MGKMKTRLFEEEADKEGNLTGYFTFHQVMDKVKEDEETEDAYNRAMGVIDGKKKDTTE